MNAALLCNFPFMLSLNHTFIFRACPLHNPLYIWFDEEFMSPSDYHSFQMAHQTGLRKKRSSGWSIKKKGGKNTGGTEQGAKASKWKSFTCHEASGSWSLHSTMSCIQLCMHSVRVTRRCWKNICCYVSRILGIKTRWCIQIYAIQAMFPRALCPSGEQLLSFTASSPLSASSN